MPARCLLAALALAAAPATPASEPAQVVFAGTQQTALGCGSDWDAACAASALAYDATDGVWQGVFSLPAGSYAYLVALDGDWAQAYGAHAQPGSPGQGIALELSGSRTVKIYYDHATHWLVDSINGRIVTAAGSFQSELGCPGDWQPDCLRSWLQDVDGDGVYERELTGLPAGFYEAKIALSEGWSENYGIDGTPGGANLPFSVASAADRVRLRFDDATHVPEISVLADLLFAAGFE